MTKTPMCKNHPDRPAVIRNDGISTGKCQECVKASAAAAQAARKEKSKMPPPGQLALIVRVLQDRAAKLSHDLSTGDHASVAASAQIVLAVVDIMAEMGALPGWEADR